MFKNENDAFMFVNYCLLLFVDSINFITIVDQFDAIFSLMLEF